MKLVPLTSDEVQTQWDALLPSIALCINSTGVRYRAEDVYLRLRTNTAWAYAIRDGDALCGVIIFTQEYDHDGLVLFVWVIGGEDLAADKDSIYAELERIAQQCKAKRIRMQSPRPGWGRETFLRQVAVVYEHEVT